jgi:hypothetical protein
MSEEMRTWRSDVDGQVSVQKTNNSRPIKADITVPTQRQKSHESPTVKESKWNSFS